MPKKKKTREQKIRAEYRREISTSSVYSLTPESLPTQAKQEIVPPIRKTTTIATSAYQYLAVDLRKTAIFTTAIVILELLLKFFTK